MPLTLFTLLLVTAYWSIRKLLRGHWSTQRENIESSSLAITGSGAAPGAHSTVGNKSPQDRPDDRMSIISIC